MEPEYHVPTQKASYGWMVLRIVISLMSWAGSAAFLHYHITYVLKQHARGATILSIASYHHELYVVVPVMIGLFILLVAILMDMRSRRLWRKPPWKLYLSALLFIGGSFSWLVIYEFIKLFRS
ncbi:hypothetical protein [Herpetosiphon giganteus]|uniref:hypothetical protein n=1 Tax=Herpetosiphon giganteus TaxID=2029754 RepID=UPI001956FFD0|nr:hypothetical protein [Herpetosiphon giganteus]MBM7844310.1 cytochrome bd-type quinol oxidase subunit 2 [Herpetosiphon giganteus]